MNMLGHDVSEYQEVRNYGGSFVVVRLTEGESYVDPLGQAHILRARLDGQLVGAYHYATVGNPTGQAKLFASQLGKTRPILPFVDIEASAAQPHNDPPAFAFSFLNTLERETQLVGGVYINFATWKAFDWSSVARAGFHLWLADWDTQRPDTPGWDPILWQNGDGHGLLDGDVFFGSADTWTALGSPRGGRPAPKPAPKPVKAGSVSYTVRAGDTLSSIAAKHGTTVGHLVQLNRIPNPNIIRIGEVLRIAGGKAAPAQLFDTIRTGDTLAAIASRNHTTIHELVKLNDIQNPNLIYADRKIRVK